MNGNIQDNPFVVQQPNLGAMGQSIANKIAAAKKKAAWQDAFNTFKGDKSPTNMMNLYQVAPEKFAQFSEGFKAMNELERTQNVQNNAEVMSMYKAGNADGASERAATLSRAYREGGQFRDAEKWDDIANAFASGKGEDAYSMLMMINSATPEGQAANEAVYAIGADRRDQFMSEADIVKTMSEVKLTNPKDMAKIGEALDGETFQYGETLKELLKLTNGSFDDMTGSQRANLLITMQKQYAEATEGFRGAQITKDKMDASLAQGTSQGDVGSIFLFMRMLDENSVVRESEFRTASGMGGLLDQMKNLADGWVDGQRLQPEQRENMSKLTDAFYKIMADKKKVIDERTDKTSDLFGFEHDLVRYNYEEGEAPEPSTAAETPAPVVNTGVKGMSLSQLQEALIKANPKWTEQQKADIRKMNERQLQEAAPNGYNYFMQQYGAADEETAGTTEVNWP